MQIDNAKAVLIALIAVFSANFAATATLAQDASPVRVDAVRREVVQHHRQVTGDLRAVARSRIAALESGIVVAAPVVEGQRVGQGDVLARLDDRRLSIQLRQIEAQLSVLESLMAEREAQLLLSQSDLDMYERLAERGAVNPKEIADARLEVSIAQARRDQAVRDIEVTNAAADLLRRRLADTVIRAPFDGVITSRLAEVGEWIGEGQAIAEIVAVGAFDVWLNVPQRNAAAVSAKDLRVGVHIEATDQDYTSSSTRVIRDVDPLARTFSLIVRIEDDEDVLSPGMSVVAWLPTGASVEQLTIHKDAILRNETGAYVYVVRSTSPEQSHAVAVPVQTLFDVHDRVVVQAPGLEAGEVVVVEGNERLAPMQPVRAIVATRAASGSSLPRSSDSASR